MAVLAPIPNARVSTATAVNPGAFASTRSPWRRSCQSVCIGTPLKSAEISADFLPNRRSDKSLWHQSFSARQEAGGVPGMSGIGKRLSRNRTPILSLFLKLGILAFNLGVTMALRSR